MNRLTVLMRCSIVFVFLIVVAPMVVAEVETDKTLSPYFAIENGDPSIDQFPLKKTKVDVTVSGVIASVVVTQTYVNDGTRPINAQYVFPASTRAAVHGMTMTIGEHVITAKIKERQVAQQEFAAAKKAGKSASLLAQQRPNVFSMDVANVMPGDEIDIELFYTELLVPTDGTYEFVFPTVVGPRYSEFTESTATDHDRWVESPYLQEGKASPTRFYIAVQVSSGLPLQEVFCPTHDVDVSWQDEQSATITLKPSAEPGGNRDFILLYRLAGKQIESGLMLYEGEHEKFFLLMVQPPATVRPENIPSREYIFIVDVSGSMNGFPLDVSKELLRRLIGSLKPTDTFNVVLFEASASAMSPESVPANADNIQKAIDVIERQRGGGGTRLLSAMETAFALPQDENTSRNLILVTDGYISAEDDVFMSIRKNLHNANVFAFGIGSSVNRHLIEGVAKAGHGECFVVTDPQEAPIQSERFRAYVEAPVLTRISTVFDGFEAYNVEPGSIPDVLAQRPLLVFGKWRGNPKGIIRVEGMSGDGEYIREFDVASTPPSAEYRALRYLWARTRVAELSDFNFNMDQEEAKREVTSLGLTYDLLTKYTSFIAVHDVVRNLEGDAENVQQPLPLPQGVSNLAVGGHGAQRATAQVSPAANIQTARRLAEPELYVLILFVVAGIGIVGTIRHFGRRSFASL